MDGYISIEDFTKVKSWFDNHESSKDRHYSIPFDRVLFLKELLYNINKEEINDGEMKVNVRRFIQLIKAKEFLQTQTKKNQYKVYSDILFAPIEK